MLQNGTKFLSSSHPRQHKRQTFQNPHSLLSFNALFMRFPTNFGLLLRDFYPTNYRKYYIFSDNSEEKNDKTFPKTASIHFEVLFPFKRTMNGQLGTFEVISLSFIIFIFVLVNLSMLIIFCLKSEKNSFYNTKITCDI